MNDQDVLIKLSCVDFAVKLGQVHAEMTSSGVIEFARDLERFIRDVPAPVTLASAPEEEKITGEDEFERDIHDSLWGSTETQPVLTQDELQALFNKAREDAASELESRLDPDKWGQI